MFHFPYLYEEQIINTKKENLQHIKSVRYYFKKKHCKFQFLMHNIQYHKYKTYYIHRKYPPFVFITLFILIFFLYSQTLPYPSQQFSSHIVFMSSYIIFPFQKKKKMFFSIQCQSIFCSTQPRQPRASTLFLLYSFFTLFILKEYDFYTLLFKIYTMVEVWSVIYTWGGFFYALVWILCSLLGI